MKLSLPNTYCNRPLSFGLLPPIRPTGRRPRWPRMESTPRRYRRKDKVVVIMGATGTGKSRLSIDIATRFPSEVINSDKMQVYKGLDITTNKIPMHQRRGVPHHLLGELDSSDGEVSPSQFRALANSVVSDISSRRRLPLVVGGSNSFIYAFLADQFESDSDGLNGLSSVSNELRYNCRFLWVDVSPDVLYEYLCRRVDDMFDAGMFDELAAFYYSEADQDMNRGVGIRKAIGVPEFDRYFRTFPPFRDKCGGEVTIDGHLEGDLAGHRRELFEEAMVAIKDNTCQLAKVQMGKILRLKSAGWDLRRLDATEVFRAVLMSETGKSSEIWKKKVMEPGMKIVRRFVEG